METFTTPVLFIIFNRPDKVAALVKALESVKPSRIYIAADGPRKGVPQDEAKCRAAREAAQNIPWPCEIRTHFSDTNLGVDLGMETAMSWFYENVEEGIICEDDCIPNGDFMRYCQDLLEKYRDDPQIFMISGTNFQDGQIRGDGSYYFSHYPTWGYAMWQRSWKLFDSKLDGLSLFESEGKIEKILKSKAQQKFWLGFFRKIRRGKYSFMDTRIMFSMWNTGGMCIIPNVNLVKNIGFGMDSTHAVTGEKERSVERGTMSQVTHPSRVEASVEADDYFFEKIHRPSLFGKIRFKLAMIIKSFSK